MTAEKKPSLAKVAQILSEYSVILDKGSVDGAKRAMRFVIFEEAEELFSPDGRSLGILEIPKGEVGITHVMERMSIADSSEVRMTSLVPSFTTYTSRAPLTVDKKDIPQRKLDLTIPVGDKARQIE